MFPIALFCAAAAVGFYIAFGYPVLLGLMARMRSKPVAKRRQQKSVSVVIAAYNGAPFIGDKLDSLLALDYPRELVEILVVSDGSTDRTDDIVRRIRRGRRAIAASGTRRQRRGAQCRHSAIQE